MVGAATELTVPEDGVRPPEDPEMQGEEKEEHLPLLQH